MAFLSTLRKSTPSPSRVNHAKPITCSAPTNNQPIAIGEGSSPASFLLGLNAGHIVRMEARKFGRFVGPLAVVGGFVVSTGCCVGREWAT